jgi:hypothetical protein
MRVAVRCGLVVAILVTVAAAQKPTAGHIVRKKVHPALPPTPAVLSQRMPPYVANPLSPEQIIPSAPEVVYDGGELTIIANNSALSEILAAVKAQMGADIDIPPAASGERIVARLGPGAPREVLASLLSWTDFDYIISGSDTDEQRVHSVILTARGKLDTIVGAGNTEVATAHPDSARSGQGPKGRVHRMPGHEDISRGKPPVLEAATAGSTASSEAVNSAEAAPDKASTSADPTTAANAESAENSDTQPAVASAAPVSAPTSPPVAASTSASLETASQGSDELGHMISDMQRLFEQRRQMQAQQNKASQGQAPAAN